MPAYMHNPQHFPARGAWRHRGGRPHLSGEWPTRELTHGLGSPCYSIGWLWQLRGGATESTGDPGTLSIACRRTAKMARLEAVLLVADVPLSPRRLAQLATLADATEARTLINRLNAAFEQAATPYRVERVAAGYRLFTLPQFAFWLGKLHHPEAELK